VHFIDGSLFIEAFPRNTALLNNTTTKNVKLFM
jgi:hypothetical protein